MAIDTGRQGNFLVFLVSNENSGQNGQDRMVHECDEDCAYGRTWLYIKRCEALLGYVNRGSDT